MLQEKSLSPVALFLAVEGSRHPKAAAGWPKPYILSAMSDRHPALRPYTRAIAFYRSRPDAERSPSVLIALELFVLLSDVLCRFLGYLIALTSIRCWHSYSVDTKVVVASVDRVYMQLMLVLLCLSVVQLTEKRSPYPIFRLNVISGFNKQV